MDERTKTVGKSFAYENLRGKQFDNQDLLECDFRGADCTGVDFSGSTLYRSCFLNANLDSAIVSLNCHFFRDTKFDRRHVEYLIYLITIADISEDLRVGLQDLLGRTKIEALDRMFQHKT